MKYFLLLLVFVVGANAFFDFLDGMNIATVNNDNVTSMDDLEKQISDLIDAEFAKLTPDNVCKDCHLSVRILIRNAAACVLGRPEVVKSIKEDFLQYNMLTITNAPAEEKRKYCQNYQEGYHGFVRCVKYSSATDSFADRKFLISFEKTIDIIYRIACDFIDVSKLVEISHNKKELLSQLPTKYEQYLQRAEFMAKNGIKPSEKDSCLPVRFAEAARIVTMLSRQFKYEDLDYISNAVHFIITVQGGYPFKSFEECA